MQNKINWLMAFEFILLFPILIIFLVAGFFYGIAKIGFRRGVDSAIEFIEQEIIKKQKDKK